MSRGHFLRTLADLKTEHMGREVTVKAPAGDVAGTLQGVISCGPKVQLALTFGGSRMWTDWYPAGTHIEIQSHPTPKDAS